jgi:hypothetical protein
MAGGRRLLLAALAAGSLSAIAAPASAMCGGNIFATCPPARNAEAAEAARLKREKRLQAVQQKKRHYPLLKKH